MLTECYDCVVVGAGLSGLVAAARLRVDGLRVLVLDKGRGVGGRLATRTFEGGRFDYGAQFFTVRTPEFQAIVVELAAAGIVAEWSHGFHLADGTMKDTGERRYRGARGMRAIATYLARDCDVRSQTAAVAVTHDQGAWTVRLADGSAVRGRGLILTSPVPQSLALLDAGSIALPTDMRADLARLTYEPCLAVMAVLTGPSGLAVPGGVWFPGEPVAWLADNRVKRISQDDTAAACITVHAGPAFSRAHADDIQTGAALLLAHVSSHLGSPVAHSQAHRWKYSRPVFRYHAAMSSVSVPGPLVFAGDAFGAGRVEGAALSGLAAAAHTSQQVRSTQ